MGVGGGDVGGCAVGGGSGGETQGQLRRACYGAAGLGVSSWKLCDVIAPLTRPHQAPHDVIMLSRDVITPHGAA